MDAQLNSAAEEPARLRRCLNDLVSLMALPALWAGADPVRIVETLLDVVLGMLGASFVVARVNHPHGGEPIETVRFMDSSRGTREAVAALQSLMDDDRPTSPPGAHVRIDGETVFVASAPLGLLADLGVVIAGAAREGFPEQTERLILEVAANQAAIALQQARLLGEQTAGRWRAEAALRDTERESRLIVDTIPGLVALLSATGDVDVANAQLLEYFGQSLEELKQWGSNGTVHPDDLPRVAEMFTRSIASGEPYDIVQRLRRGDGVYRWMQNRGFPLRARSGQISRWCVLLTDIDDQKRAEDALLESEREARLIVDTIPGLVVILADSGAVAFENERTREYLGPDLSDTGNWASNGIVHPDDLSRVLPLFSRGIASGAPFEYEVRLRHFSGSYRWFQLRAHPLRDSTGRVSRWYVLFSDIDDRRRTEEELRRSEVFLAEGQRISLTGTFSWQVNTDHITFSKELERMFEFDRDAVVTVDRITERVHPKDLALLADRMAAVRAGHDNPEYELRLQMPDGRVRHVRVFGRVIRHDDGRLECVGAVQDVTRRRLAEDARDVARAELAHITKAMSLSALTASIAHEVNQPLAGIITNANTCLRMLAADPPDVDGARETARRTIRDGNRASDVVTRLRALFSNRQFTLEVFDLNEAAREVIELSLSDLKRNHVILRTELVQDLPAVMGDRVQLQQVILNLLRNAADAMAGVHDRDRQLLVKTQREETDALRLTVRDVGEGLDPRNVDRIFNPFYTTKSGGMGIGLSVSRSIVEKHHGRLWAEPNDGAGATFSFSIPLHPPALPDTVLAKRFS
jgi:PAS domain S-box-containing protein